MNLVPYYNQVPDLCSSLSNPIKMSLDITSARVTGVLSRLETAADKLKDPDLVIAVKDLTILVMEAEMEKLRSEKASHAALVRALTTLGRYSRPADEAAGPAGGPAAAALRALLATPEGAKPETTTTEAAEDVPCLRAYRPTLRLWRPDPNGGAVLRCEAATLAECRPLGQPEVLLAPPVAPPAALAVAPPPATDAAPTTSLSDEDLYA